MILSVARQKRGTSTLVLLGPSTTASRATTSWKNLCSGLGRPFFRMLFRVVSEKCNRPMDTRIGWSPRKASLIGKNLFLDRSVWLCSTESKLDWEESLPGPVSLALLNLNPLLL